MYSLVQGFWTYISRKDKYNILILGLDDSGKTTLLENAKCNFEGKQKQSRTTPTVGLNMAKIEIDGITLNFWDLGGQRELRNLWSNYFSEAHAFIWVVDSCDRSRLEESSEAFSQTVTNNLLDNLPLLFVINKQDVTGAMPPDNIISAFRSGINLLGARRFLSVPASALKGDSIKRSIKWLAEQVKFSPRPPCED